MPDSHSAPAVVVGVDGSPAALDAAVWAADEAASRDIPLKLVYVIHPGRPADDPARDADAADEVLSAARHLVENTGKPVTIETEAVRGNPLATLIERSRSAVLVCVGSVGVEHTCHRAGSTAAALAGSARCPVAVIHSPRTAVSGRIVAEVDGSPDNSAVLGWAMAEARLRRVPLRVIMPVGSPAGESAAAADSDSAARALLNHRIDRWARQYPDVAVESIIVHDADSGSAEYRAAAGDSVRLFVTSTRDLRGLGRPGEPGGSSVLTVGGTRP